MQRSHRDCRVYTDRQRGKQSSEKRDLELKMKNIAALRQPPYVIDRVRGSVAGDAEAASYEHL